MAMKNGPFSFFFFFNKFSPPFFFYGESFLLYLNTFLCEFCSYLFFFPVVLMDWKEEKNVLYDDKERVRLL